MSADPGPRFPSLRRVLMDLWSKALRIETKPECRRLRQCITDGAHERTRRNGFWTKGIHHPVPIPPDMKNPNIGRTERNCFGKTRSVQFGASARRKEEGGSARNALRQPPLPCGHFSLLAHGIHALRGSCGKTADAPFVIAQKDRLSVGHLSGP